MFMYSTKDPAKKENTNQDQEEEEEKESMLIYLLEKLRDGEPLADGIYVKGIDVCRSKLTLEIAVGKQKCKGRAKINYVFYIRKGVAEFIIEDYPRRVFAKGVHVKVYMGQKYTIKNRGVGKLEVVLSPAKDRIQWNCD